MEPAEEDGENSVPRYLDELEIIERKNLRRDSKAHKRWRLNKPEDNMVLAEMGVSILENEPSPPNAAEEITCEDIENRSPNLGSLKANKHKNMNSASKETSGKFKHLDSSISGVVAVGSARKRRVSREGNPEQGPPQSKTAKYENDRVFCDSASKMNSNLCISAIEKDVSNTGHTICTNPSSCDRKVCHIASTSSKSCEETDARNLKRIKNKSNNNLLLVKTRSDVGECDELSENEKLRVISEEVFDSEDFEELESAHRDVLDSESSQSDVMPRLQLSSDNSSSQQAMGELPSLEPGSPRTSCGPHPALHRPPATMPRHTTFDEGPSDSQHVHVSGKDHPSTSCPEEALSQFDVHAEIDQFLHESEITLINPEPNSENCYFENFHCHNVLSENSESSPLESEIEILESSPNERNVKVLLSKARTDAACGKVCFTSLNTSFCSDAVEDLKDADFVNGDLGMFSKLSDEMVLSIFQWLPKRILVKCMLVCQRWRQLGLDCRLWSRLDLGGRVLSAGSVPHIISRNPVVVRMANAHIISPVMSESLSPEWRIQCLDLSAASISPSCLGRLLQSASGLVRLSLEGLLLDEGTPKAIANMPNLRALNLALCHRVDTAMCEAIVTRRRLEHLNVSWSYLDAEALTKLCSNLPSSVQRLNLAGCRKILTDEMVVSVVRRCADLVELDISDAALVTCEVGAALSHLARLEHLAMSRCYRFTIEGYKSLSSCKSLQWLDSFGVLPPLSEAGIQRVLPRVQLNKFIHSSIARPTVGTRRTSIWGLRTRDT